MSTALAVSGFAEEAQMLLRIAADLGRFHGDDNRDEFLSTLIALDMTSDEAKSYWDALDHDYQPKSNGIDWLADIKNNTEMSAHLGIALRSQVHPRNLLLYRLAELHFQGFFEVKVSGSVHMGGIASRGNPPGRRVVCFPKQPAKENRRNGKKVVVDAMAAYEMYKGREPTQFSTRLLRYAESLETALGSELGLRVAELLIGCKMEKPNPKMSKLLARIIRQGQDGEIITIVGAFCPDYAYEETGNTQIPYIYTFDGVGEGVGLVARQFARIVPEFSRFLSELGIKHRFVLGIGDFEADSQDVLDQVGLSREEFIDRCRSSLEAFRDAVPDDLSLELELFDRERGKGRFRECASEATELMISGNFGYMSSLYDNLPEIIARIPKQYRTFYQRWYGTGYMEDERVRDFVLAQAGEYASMTRIYCEDFGENVLVLAGDRPEMHCFNAFYQLVPTLCAKRAY
jgi:hypothetical protein